MRIAGAARDALAGGCSGLIPFLVLLAAPSLASGVAATIAGIGTLLAVSFPVLVCCAIGCCLGRRAARDPVIVLRRGARPAVVPGTRAGPYPARRRRRG